MQFKPKHDLALIFTATEHDIGDLEISLSRFIDSVKAISDDFLCLVVLQVESGSKATLSTEHRSIDIIITEPRGASAARNIGLEAVINRASRIMFVDCRTILSASFCQGVFSDAARSAPVWIAQVNWQNMAGVAYAKLRGVKLIDVAYAGFLWRCVFQAELLVGCRFDERIGPGTESRIQAGEDCLFMRDVIIKNGLRQAVHCRDAVIDRLPRPDVSSKLQRYAFGMGYRMGLLLRTPFSIGQRLALVRYFIYFTLRSLQFLCSHSIDQREIGAKRIGGLVHGFCLLPSER